jgi:hypothetical protein
MYLYATMLSLCEGGFGTYSSKPGSVCDIKFNLSDICGMMNAEGFKSI